MPRRRGVKRFRRRSFRRSSFIKKVAKRVVQRAAETKSALAVSVGVSVTEGSAPVYWAPPTILPGTSSTGRVGNQIFARGIKYKFQYYNASATKALVLRQILLRVNAGRFRDDASITAAFFEGQTDLAAPQGNPTDLLRKVNREGLKVLSDRVVKILPSVPGNPGGGTKYTKLWIRTNEKWFYRDSGTAQPTNVRYVVATMAVDATNGGGVSTVSTTGTARLYYNDI